MQFAVDGPCVAKILRFPGSPMSKLEHSLQASPINMPYSFMSPEMQHP
jgi:hypothetical protein